MTESEKKLLLSTARDSIGSILKGIPPPVPDYMTFPKLKLNSGVFVTLTIDDDLRGCIGYIYPPMNLFQAVCDAAIQSAFNDPRFIPLIPEEFDKIKIEISILSVPVLINSYEEIQLGVHGLILEEDPFRALLLPQVATKHNFTIEQFLSSLCEKARLSPDYYLKRKLKIKVFTANIFSETELLNKVP